MVAKRKQDILLCVGDAGSWDYFSQPHVYGELKRRYKVDLRADSKGAAKDKLDKACIPYTPSDGSELFAIDALDKYAAVLCGTAGKAFDLWENATRATEKARKRVAWFGDFYRSGCETRMHDYMPDYFASFDDTTMDAFRKINPHVPEHCLRVVGNPSFDAIASFDVRAARAKVRDLLGIRPEQKVAVYSGSSMGQFDLEHESLDNLFPILRGRGLSFAFRFHPADVGKRKEDVERLQKRMKQELNGALVDSKGLVGLDLAAIADVFVTDYSTEGVRACLAGIPTVFLMLPTADEYLRLAKGSTFPHFSILEKNRDGWSPALVAATPGEVGVVIDQALSPLGRGEMAAALKHPRFQVLCDGHAGDRVLEFIEEIVVESP